LILGKRFEFWRHVFESWRHMFEFWRHTLREIMLFIGKPIGRSIMMSNRHTYENRVFLKELWGVDGFPRTSGRFRHLSKLSLLGFIGVGKKYSTHPCLRTFFLSWVSKTQPYHRVTGPSGEGPLVIFSYFYDFLGASKRWEQSVLDFSCMLLCLLFLHIVHNLVLFMVLHSHSSLSSPSVLWHTS